MSAGASLSEVAAKVIVDGCLSNIAGTANGEFPPGARFLPEEERLALRLPPGGRTMFYAVGDSGVYINIQGVSTIVWFNGDSSTVLTDVERALKRRYPQAVQRVDEPVPSDEFSRRRSYDVPLGGDRAAIVDLGYPAPGALAGGFVGRVLAYARSAQKS